MLQVATLVSRKYLRDGRIKTKRVLFDVGPHHVFPTCPLAKLRNLVQQRVTQSCSLKVLSAETINIFYTSFFVLLNFAGELTHVKPRHRLSKLFHYCPPHLAEYQLVSRTQWLP